MDKKDEVLKKEIVYDDKEDLEIKKAAYFKTSSQKFLLWVLILLFCIMLSTMIIFVNSYYKNKTKENNYDEVIEIKNIKNNVLITNNGKINIDSLTTEENTITVEKLNTIELFTSEDSESGVIHFNVKYEILKNDFKLNAYATNDSDVLVRFSYSFDNEKWEYINNVISTNDSTLSPLMGNFYDIAGIKSNLNVVTNYELTSQPNESIKMYWRAETIFKNKNEKETNNSLEANFKIEYKDNA